jgi:beta-glucosidase
MVPIRHHWQNVYRSALQGVQDGSIPMSRIDDAVTRILRVKMRANLWHKPAPTERRYGGQQAMLGALNHREVAREAVRKSLVLLKNKQSILPLKHNQTILLTGSAANDIQKQSGGWNLTWQGDENELSDFPGATTLKMALEQAIGKDNVVFDPELTSQLKAGDVAVVAFGEDPYAEMMGDIKAWQTLEYAKLKRSYARDCQIISQLHEAGVKVISIFFSGRPLYLNEEISKSDAFVAAFLPGSEGEGMTDVLIANAQGEPDYDFVGTLSYSWPNKKDSATVNSIPSHIPGYQVPENEQSPLGEHAPLFNYGYGLNYSDRKQKNDLDNLVLDVASGSEVENATHSEHLYGIRATIGDYQLKVADATHWMGVDVSRNNAMDLDTVLTKPYNYQQQQDAVELTLLQGDSYVYIQTGDGLAADFSQFQRHGSVSFEIKLLEEPSEPIYLSVQRASSPEQQGSLEKYDLSHLIGNQMDEFVTVKVECDGLLLDESNFAALDTPFVLYTQGRARFVLANICWNAN